MSKKENMLDKTVGGFY